MSLDLTKLVNQVSDMVTQLRAGSRERQEHLDNALKTLSDSAGNVDALRDKVNASKTTWLVAYLVDGLNGRYKAPTIPEDFTVVATDGSQIDVDRHRSARCYLINIGSVMLKYGTSPVAVMETRPHLYAGDNEMVITAPGMHGREQPVEGALLGLKRGVDECRRLAELAAEAPAENPVLALLDGTLIMWGLQAYPEFVSEELLENGFLPCLEELRKLSAKQDIALASYISLPRSTDVINTLRIALCPRATVDSDQCLTCDTRECDALTGVRDRELFTGLLEPGERSDTFISSSKIQNQYGPHQVYFYYLNLDDEIARIEVPHWVATSKRLLDLTHSLVVDQCRRGQGYPVALSEAHEKAVVTGTDAASFWQLVESLLEEGKLPITGSAKSRSKRTRWV